MKNEILGVFENNNCKIGHQMSIGNFIGELGNEFRGDIIYTLREMIEEGLLEQKPDKHESMFFLTEKGYREING